MPKTIPSPALACIMAAQAAGFTADGWRRLPGLGPTQVQRRGGLEVHLHHDGCSESRPLTGRWTVIKPHPPMTYPGVSSGYAVRASGRGAVALTTALAEILRKREVGRG